jgi:CHAD domain-containing protein
MLALEAAEPMAVGAAALQDVLGEQHDSVVAGQWLRDIAATNVTRAEAMVAGLLIAAEQRDAQEWGAKWPDAWDALSKRKVRKWLG